MKYGKMMTMLMLTGVILLLGACSQEVKPRAINEETDVCEVCNMAVMDNQFATQAILENKKVLTFDDIGCMFTWKNESMEKIKATFVRDYNTEDWIESEKAFYVYEKSIKTPMAYNVISFAEEKDAKTFTEKNGGELLSYEDLSNHKWEMNKEMMDMEGMEPHSHSEDGMHGGEGSEEHSHEEESSEEHSH
ncbi:nitrous oxide reductase accessory protein NosL [Metabacillus sp. SLBN-84]